MKKLRLNKIFHWLYAFLMFYPIVCFFGTIVISAFNNTLSLSDFDMGSISRSFWDVIDSATFSYGSNTIGRQIQDVYSYVINGLLGSEGSDNSTVVIDLLSYWTYVSFVYLVFDVLMYPINLFHRWIDEGGI